MKKIITSLLTVSLIIVAGCHAGGGDPKAVLTSFFNALAKKDFDAAKKLSTKDSETMIGMIQMGMQMAGKNADADEMSKFNKEDMEIGDAVINGDVATVPVKEKKSGETTDFTLKKEDGSWKVAFDKSTLMQMGEDKMKEGGVDMNNMKMNPDEMEKAGKMLDSAKQMMQQMKDSMK